MLCLYTLCFLQADQSLLILHLFLPKISLCVQSEGLNYILFSVKVRDHLAVSLDLSEELGHFF